MSTNLLMGRLYDHLTHTWAFGDGSGAPVPDELMPREDMTGRVPATELFRFMRDRDAHTQRAQAQQRGLTP